MRVISFILLPFLSIALNNVKANEKITLQRLINENMDAFNTKSLNEDKQETSFTRITKSYQVFDIYEQAIGEVVVFDNNSGYLFVDKDYCIKKESYDHGIDESIFSSSVEKIYFNKSEFYLNVKDAISDKLNFCGSISSVDEMFFSHLDTNFTSAKTRNITQELDSWYPTYTDTSIATYYYKTTHCTNQTGNDCGPLAIANLLWTYRINNIVDLTYGAASSAALAQNLQNYVSYDSSLGTNVWNITSSSNYFSGTGYYIDYTNVANGIASTLTYAPIVGFYYAGTVAHYALITGKGKSLYKKILGISFYTSWDIVNTWYSPTYSRPDKYWVDNQYIYFGYVLRNSNGDTVSL